MSNKLSDDYKISKTFGQMFYTHSIDEIMNYSDRIFMVKGVIENMLPKPMFHNNSPMFFLISMVRHNIEIVLDILELNLHSMIREEIYDDDDCFIVYLTDTNCLDFFGKVYSNVDLSSEFYDHVFYEFYMTMCGSRQKNNYFEFTKTCKEAVSPFKSRPSDSGYDLTLIKKVKQYGTCELYDTGIKIKPKFGFYFDLVPRSSIIKTGYMLANNVGVIDAGYRESIKVALIKIDPNAKPLVMPNRLVQLIPRKIYHQEIREVDDLKLTDRNLLGFGSSN